MACITPPALTDEQLLALIDGAADDDVAAHVQQCADCRSRAKQLARQQGQLARQLYRVACPSPFELGEYQLRLLPAARMSAVTEHLSTCMYCGQEIQTLQGYLLDLAPTLVAAPPPKPTRESLGRRLQSLVATLVDTLADSVTGGGPTPAFAGLRGEPEPPFIYEADGLQIIIESQIDTTQLERKALLGLVLGLDEGQRIEVSLEQAGQSLLSTAIDERGNFVFEHLVTGAYTLILRSAEKEIRVNDLQV